MLQAVKNAAKMLANHFENILTKLWKKFAAQHLYTCTNLGNKNSLAVAVWRFRHPAIFGGVNSLTWQTELTARSSSWKASVGTATPHAPEWLGGFLVSKLPMSNLDFCLKTA